MATGGRRKLGKWSALALLGVALAAYWWTPETPDAPATEETPDAPTVTFTLVDHHGEPATPADFAEEWLLVFFGFTHCPDICPSSLMKLSRVLKHLAEDAERVQPLMISVDPERDTPAVLAEYVTHFHPDIVGLTGTPEQVENAAASFHAYYAQVPYGSENDYTVDHSAFFYLIDPAREFAEMYPHGMGSEAIAEDIKARLRQAD